MTPPFLLALALLPAPELPALSTGELYVSDFNNDRVAVYAADGSYLRAFAAPGLNGTRGIVFADDGTFFVASQLNHTIYRFAADETLLDSITHAPMTSPTGIAIGPAGELYVSSFNTSRIWVFAIDGTFLRSFTGPGFTTPNCVAFDSQGNIYAASAGRGSVYKWDPAENFLMEMDTPAGVNLFSPMGIARDENDVLYVAGGSSDNIVKFATDGSFLGELSHPDLTGPQGVVFDDRGHLFSSSFYQHVLVEFDANEQYLRTVSSGGLSIPRSLAFDPGRGPSEFPSLCTGDGGNGAGCTDCPCSNNASPGTAGGCLHSQGGSAGLHVFGTASVAGADLRLEVALGPANSFAILVSGSSVAPTNPMNPCFGLNSGLTSLSLDGLRCAVSGVVRHGTRVLDTNGAVGASGPGWGAPDGPASGLALQAGAVSGETRYFQAIYRDSPLAGCGSGLNTTQAREVNWTP